jgi:hypothetical protein
MGPDASPSAPNADATVVNGVQAEDEQADDAGLDANAACPEAEAVGADGAILNLPPCDDASPLRICSFFESEAVCIEGHWLNCGVNAGDRCVDDAAPLEGSLCCPFAYMPHGIVLPPCCPGGRLVSCPLPSYKIVYGDPCGGGDASSDATDASAD